MSMYFSRAKLKIPVADFRSQKSKKLTPIKPEAVTVLKISQIPAALCQMLLIMSAKENLVHNSTSYQHF